MGVECVWDCALHWVGTPTRVSPTLCLVFPWIGSRLPTTLRRKSGMENGWMDVIRYNRYVINFSQEMSLGIQRYPIRREQESDIVHFYCEICIITQS